MEMDVIRQLEEQMKIFGIQVIRLRTGDPEETEFDLGLRRALGIRRDSGADLKMMADLLEEDTLYFIRDVFGVHYICLRLPGQDAGDETACFLHIGPYLTGDRETVWEETVKKAISLSASGRNCGITILFRLSCGLLCEQSSGGRKSGLRSAHDGKLLAGQGREARKISLRRPGGENDGGVEVCGAGHRRHRAGYLCAEFL